MRPEAIAVTAFPPDAATAPKPGCFRQVKRRPFHAVPAIGRALVVAGNAEESRQDSRDRLRGVDHGQERSAPDQDAQETRLHRSADNRPIFSSISLPRSTVPVTRALSARFSWRRHRRTRFGHSTDGSAILSARPLRLNPELAHMNRCRTFLHAIFPTTSEWLVLFIVLMRKITHSLAIRSTYRSYNGEMSILRPIHGFPLAGLHISG